MTLLNGVLNRLFDVALSPLQPFPAGAGLAVVSALMAALVLAIVRATSDQSALAAVKRQIHADLFEIRLFNDDLPAMLRAQLDILRHNLTYLRLSLVPLLWMAIPLVLVFGQLQAHFGYSGVDIAKPVLVTAQLRSSEPIEATLETAPGLRAETPAISLPALRQLVWRVVPETRGDYTLRLHIGGLSYEKALRVSEGVGRRSPRRPARGVVDQIEYPSENPTDDSGPVVSIAVSYPDRRFDVLGWQFSWVTVFVVESLVFAMLLRKPMRVTI